MDPSVIHELGEGPRAKRSKKRLRRMVPRDLQPKPKSMASNVVDRGVASYLGAMANVAAIENSRPNRAYSLIGGDPTATIPAGGTASFSFTLPTDAFLVYWVVTDLDTANFVVTSLKVAGFDVIGGSPINLAAFRSETNRVDRPGPLTGRLFDGGTTIEVTVRNITAAPQLFRGLTVWMISTDCASTTKGKPAPSILSFRSLASGFRNIFARKGVVR